MYTVQVRIDGIARFLSAEKRAGKLGTVGFVADAKRYPTLQGARTAARNVGGVVRSLKQARRDQWIAQSLRAIRARDVTMAINCLDLALAI